MTDYKLRPTFTKLELEAIEMALAESIKTRITVGDFQSMQVVQMGDAKKYVTNFLAKLQFKIDSESGDKRSLNGMLAAKRQPTMADKLRALGMYTEADELEGIGAGPVNTANTESKLYPATTNLQFTSVLDNPSLTDEQKFEYLETQDSSLFTEAEQVFYLNVGTKIKIERMMNTKKVIKSDDL